MKKQLRIAICVLALYLPFSSSAIEFAKIQAHTNTVVPTGAGPFPLVLLLAGCGGFGDRYDQAQREWAMTGLMSIRIDLIAANAVSNCRELSTDEAITDTIDAVRQLSQLPEVKPGAINLMGVSWGGAIALAILSESLPINAMVLLYPACRFTKHLAPNPVELPTLVIHGEADLIAPMRACREKFSVISDLKLLTFPGAPHGFLGWRQFKSETRIARREYRAFFRR